MSSDHGKWAKHLDPVSVDAENQEAIAREWCEEEGLVWDDVLDTWMHPDQASEPIAKHGDSHDEKSHGNRNGAGGAGWWENNGKLIQAKSLASGKKHNIKSCDHCGKPIAFVEGKSGKKYPADVYPAAHGDDYTGVPQYRVYDWSPHKETPREPEVDVDYSDPEVQSAIERYREIESRAKRALDADDNDALDEADAEHAVLRREFRAKYGSDKNIRRIATGE